MTELRGILVKGLATALKTATGYGNDKVLSLVPDGTAYPYIYIAEIYQKETGAKTGYRYELDTLIQVVHQLIDSKIPLYTDMSAIMNLVQIGGSAITLDSPFKCEQIVLGSSSEAEILDSKGVKINVGLIRVTFLIN